MAASKKQDFKEMPSRIEPMLATLTDAPFSDADWWFEVKWDGYRALAYVNGGDVALSSRNNKSFSEKYYPVAEALAKWRLNAVFDGEIVVIGPKGKADFGALQNWRSEADGALVYYVFDVLWHDGKSLMKMPLSQRREILGKILPHDDTVRLSEVFQTDGKAFFDAASNMRLEGIMAKRRDSTYVPGSRTRDWLKIKVSRRQEVVIGGYTRNEGSAKPFSSLLLGVYQGDTLRYVGKVGTGFTERRQQAMLKTFAPLETDTCPFSQTPDVNKPSRFRPDPPKADAVWLRPKLVCEVKYAEITSDGVFRHPSFVGMRDDKAPSDVVLEESDTTGADDHNLLAPPKARNRATLLNPKEETQVKKVKGHSLKFTHLSKSYWPDDGITKRDMLNYYYQAAPFVLPYLKDRPLSLNRFPNGINGHGFYQKDVKGKAPDWVKTFPYTTSDGEDKEFLVGDREDTLLWMASLGCIEMNPWFSRVQHPENPDYCVIDLDPDKNTFEQVIEAARTVKNILDAIGVPSYAKTSGSTGIHIYIPLGTAYSYDQSQMFGKLIVSIAHRELPGYTSLERQIKNRKGKMYLDFLQNRPGATLASPYSLRPKPGATVSMPLHWDEVKPGLSMRDFTIHTAMGRMRESGDIFKPVLGKGIDMAAALAKAQTTFY